MRTIKWTEFCTHSDAGSLWILIHGSVYDVTSFLSTHPGGDQLLHGGGKEATALFESMHPNMRVVGTTVLPKYKIGVIDRATIRADQDQYTFSQRICLARTLYSDSDIVLLDDPFAAMDAHVALHLYKECVVKYILGQNKTLIMVTNVLGLLEQCDHILAIRDGTIGFQGPPSMFLEDAAALETYGVHVARNDNVETMDFDEQKMDLSDHVAGVEFPPEQDAPLIQTLVAGQATENSFQSLWVPLVRFGGTKLFVIACVSLACGAAAAAMLPFWVGRWTFQPASENALNFGIFVGFILAENFFVFVASRLFCLHRHHFAHQVHSRYVGKLKSATMAFFDSTPVGRILDHLNQNLYYCDTAIHLSLERGVSQVLRFVAFFVFLLWLNWWLALVIIPFGFCAILLIYYAYRPILKYILMASCTFTPVFQHAAEVIPAASVLRCFGQLESHQLLHYEYVNTSTRAEDTKFQAFTWLLVRLDAVGALALTCIVALLVALREQIAPDTIGASLSFALYLSTLIPDIANTFIWLQIEGANADRLFRQIQGIPQERAGGPVKLRPEWPAKNCIVEFENCSLRYRPELPLVMRGVSMRFGGSAQGRVGIVGRTGAGKSSVLAAILRLAELEEGRIIIDGVDIANVPLSELRRRIVIIPQEVTLFEGTIRSNIDPFEQYSDKDIEEMMKLCLLPELPLETPVLEGGKNISLGYQQLLCLCRALIRKPSLCLMDESMSSIDVASEAAVLNVVGSVCKNASLVLVAHRLSSLSLVDYVIFMENGAVVESGAPDILMGGRSRFRALVHAQAALTLSRSGKEKVNL